MLQMRSVQVFMYKIMKTKHFENPDINKESDIICIDNDAHNGCDYDTANSIEYRYDDWLHRDIESRIDETEAQELFGFEHVNPKSPEDKKFEKSYKTINKVLERNDFYNDVFVSKKPELLTQNINNRELDKAVDINKTSVKQETNGMLNQTDKICQSIESSSNTVAKSLQTLNSGVMNQASQEFVIEKAQNERKMQIPDRLELHGKRNSKSEATTTETLAKLQNSFKCDLCSMKFRLHDTLVRHLIYVHDVDEKKAKYFGTP